MRSEFEGKLRAQTPAEGGFQPLRGPARRPGPECPECHSTHTRQASGGKGVVRYYECLDGDHRFKK